jgi:hypothetical protein
MSINPDAHATCEIDLTPWDMKMAHKGCVPTDGILKCMPLGAFNRRVSSRSFAGRASSAPAATGAHLINSKRGSGELEREPAPSSRLAMNRRSLAPLLQKDFFRLPLTGERPR